MGKRIAEPLEFEHVVLGNLVHDVRVDQWVSRTRIASNSDVEIALLFADLEPKRLAVAAALVSLVAAECERIALDIAKRVVKASGKVWGQKDASVVASAMRLRSIAISSTGTGEVFFDDGVLSDNRNSSPATTRTPHLTAA